MTDCMNISHFVKIYQVLTILHQLICRGVTNFGTRCISLAILMLTSQVVFFLEHEQTRTDKHKVTDAATAGMDNRMTL